MTDNAKDMTGKDNGLMTLLKKTDANLFITTCICHSLNLVISNTLKYIYNKKTEENSEDHDKLIDQSDNDDLLDNVEQLDSELSMSEFNIRYFINKIASFFHFSYKRNDDYIKFRNKFLADKKVQSLYPEYDKFLKLQRYSLLSKNFPIKKLNKNIYFF